MAGRPPKPKGAKIIQGTFRKDRDNGEAPRPKLGIPEAPAWMPVDAHQEWGRVVSEMENLGIIAKLDMTVLAAYCVLWAKFKAWGSGQGDAGDMNAGMIAQLRGLMGTLGLGPANRERLHIQKPDKKQESKFGAFGGGK